MSDWRQVTDGLAFPEGPIAMADGSVVLVEIKGGRLTKVGSDGTTTTVAHTGGGPNGAAMGPDGKIYVCNNGGFEWHEFEGLTVPGHQPDDYIGGRIQRVDPEDGTVEDLYTECDGNPLRGPNDLVFDDDGGFWFSDLGKGRERDLDRGGLYYAKADGSEIREVVYPLDQPNGVGLSPDGGRVYVAETPTGRVWCWDLDRPGQVLAKHPMTPGGGSLLYATGDYQFFDSLAVDAEGNVCVATIPTGAITVIAPDGSVVDVVAVPEYDPFVTNICFGGDDLTTAYITSSGRGLLYATRWATAGLALPHQG